MSARDKLNDYARETATHTFTVSATGNQVEVPVGQRGELAGKAFVALQDVLSYLDSADDGHGADTDDIREIIWRAFA
ncbi:hypothetical protein [Amycolatopsis orientalis]|uniref:hypothetical protein n=1 Tax=Amycolatopsis orientalis TaxID=31958 RepID=UPI00039D033D|nr:hypothetical protein [Amycolatopsis orientalis]